MPLAIAIIGLVAAGAAAAGEIVASTNARKAAELDAQAKLQAAQAAAQSQQETNMTWQPVAIGALGLGALILAARAVRK